MDSVGFIVNPLAGLGGSVGLKGSDGLADEALKRGAKPNSEKRALKALESVPKQILYKFLTCRGSMGESVLKKAGFSCETVYTPGKRTTASDTKKACEIFKEQCVSLIVFAGGDGTARDVFEVVGSEIPILGIPAGVKMHSAVFALNPKACGELIKLFIEEKVECLDAEVIDVDENAYRRNVLSTKLFGIAKTPYMKEATQAGKTVLHAEKNAHALEDLAKFTASFMEEDTLYFLGAGSTTKAVADEFKLDKTLLGVDTFFNDKIIGKDLSEKEILKLLNSHSKSKIIVSPTGRQGFVFGRGNQQFSPKVLRKVGVKNVIVIATPQKLKETPVLHVDTGDLKLDAKFGKHLRVVCGWKLAARLKLS